MFRGIRLLCRKDYTTNKIWPKHGFIPIGEKKGRGKEEKTLTCWWFDHGHPTLFTFAAEKQIENKRIGFVDTNILIDWFNDESEESKALLADWLKDELELCVADEILNEIDRSEDAEKRKIMKERAHNLTRPPFSKELFKTVSKRIRKHFPAEMSESDQSDLKHLAQSIVVNADFFITRDQRLLDCSDKIKEEHSMEILRPSDLIVKLNESNYHPVRLAGTTLSVRNVLSGEQETIFDEFRSLADRETKSGFLEKLRIYLSNPANIVCSVVLDDTQKLAFFVLDRSDRNKLSVKFLRFKKSNLTSTLLSHVLFNFLRICVNENRSSIEIADSLLSSDIQKQLIKDKFIKHGKHWFKIIFDFVGNKKQINKKVRELISGKSLDFKIFSGHDKILKNQKFFKSAEAIFELQKIFWPLKVKSSKTNFYLVPIKPGWAKDLFDENIAREDLFGAKKELAISREQVYYRASRPSGIKSPGGILWYVSEDKAYSGTSCVRAFSQLESVEISKPKELFKKYARLGIYTWDDVLKTAKGSIQNDVMAMKFCDTELFKNPIPLKQLKEIFSKKKIGLQVQSPLKISNKLFVEIYNLGHGKNG